MTATYDGRLVVTDKTVEPCCAVMHTLVSLGAVRPGKSQKSTVAWIVIAERKLILRHCPNCGAEVNA
ncbi:MAG: hypothetical protein RBR71_12355 [Gudongella sp.]|mgnify:FL=1|jgi:hypothetical protein|nr:hypothetical protein [Gudongella sp.]